MDYSRSWTEPGQGFDLQETISYNLRPDNPRDKVGDAANRRTEYSHIYVKGLQPKMNAKFVKDFKNIIDTKWLKKDIWGTVGKNRKDVVLSGKEIRITNSKLGHLGGSQSDVAMVIKQIYKWLVDEDIDGKIGSVLHSQR